MIMKMLAVILGLLAFLCACSDPGEVPQTHPSNDWMIGMPEGAGMDSELLSAMVAEIVEEELPVHGVIVIRHGKLVFEAYFEPYTVKDRHIIYSATKSVTAMLVGAAIADGLIAGDTQPAAELLPDYRDLLTKHNDAGHPLRIQHLLTMTAGFDWSDGPYGVAASGDFSRLLGASDGIAYLLHTSRAAEPGSRYNYNSGGSHLLAAILQEVTGKTTLDYATDRLFEPIGIRDAAWSEYQGINNGGSELFLRPRDMARLGQLVLHGGSWDGRQVLPAEWVEKMTAPMLSTNVEQLGEDYGYGWYTKQLGEHTVWSAEGLGGNGIYVVPDLDMVVVFTGGLVGREMLAPYRFIEQNILEAVRSDEPLPPKPDLERPFEQALRKAPEFTVTLGSSHILESVSGKIFEIDGDDNLLGIEELGFDFLEDGSGRMRITYFGTGKDEDWGVDVVLRTDDLLDEQEAVEFELGLDGFGRTTLVEHDEMGMIPVLVEGRWKDDCRLGLNVVTGWAIPQTWALDFCEKNAVSLEIKSIFYDTAVTGTANPTQPK